MKTIISLPLGKPTVGVIVAERERDSNILLPFSELFYFIPLNIVFIQFSGIFMSGCFSVTISLLNFLMNFEPMRTSIF
jgi:hypothetical protein